MRCEQSKIITELVDPRNQTISVYVSVHHHVDEVRKSLDRMHHRVYHLAKAWTNCLSLIIHVEKNIRGHQRVKKTNTANATSLNKRFNEQYNDWTRVIHISLPSSAKQHRESDQVLCCLETANHDGWFLNSVQMAANYKFYFWSPSLHGPSIIHRRFEFDWDGFNFK